MTFDEDVDFYPNLDYEPKGIWVRTLLSSTDFELTRIGFWWN